MPAGLFLCGSLAPAAGKFAFAVAELLGQAGADEVDGLIKVVAMIFGMDIRAGNGEMDLDHESVLGAFGFVVVDGDVGADREGVGREGRIRRGKR